MRLSRNRLSMDILFLIWYKSMGTDILWGFIFEGSFFEGFRQVGWFRFGSVWNATFVLTKVLKNKNNWLNPNVVNGFRKK